MIRVEPTRDKEWLWKVATHPAIYDSIRCGQTPNREEVLSRVDNPNSHYLRGISVGELMGFFAFEATPLDSHNLHIAILPEYRGKNALAAFRCALLWMFQHGAKRIDATFEQRRRDVKCFIGRAGFKKRWESPSISFYTLERNELCLG